MKQNISGVWTIAAFLAAPDQACTVLAAAESQVRTGLPAGGRRIRTCMGFFLSSGSFRFIASSLFGAGRAVLHPVACDQVPGVRAMVSRDRNASKAWRLCRLAALVFRSALTPEHAEGR